MTGTTLSHYRIVSELGRGGMGIVYKARDTKLDRDVAIKVLPSSALASDDDRARFYREAKAAAALNHPNIAQIYQIDEAVPSDAPHGTQPSPFIVMEYIDGETLSDRIAKGPMKIEDAVRLTRQIADALKVAHANDIVHRDIKSSNVMLTSDGSAKVLDFGLAKTAHSTMLTRMGSTLGTVAYMSPEQARGEDVDARSDLYSLGTVLYEMVAGRRPYSAEYEQAVVYGILNEPAEPLTSLRTGVPLSLEQIAAKCLEKDRELRYQSAAGLIADLKAFDRGGSTVTRSAISAARMPASPAMPPSPDEATHTGAGSGLAATVPWLVAVLGLAAGAAAMWLFLPQPDPPPMRRFEVRVDQLLATNPAVSPDGRYWAFEAMDSLNLSGITTYDLRTGEYERIPESTEYLRPKISPDGQWLMMGSSNETVISVLPRGRPTALPVTGISYGWYDQHTVMLTDNTGGLTLLDLDSRESEFLDLVAVDSTVVRVEDPTRVPGTDHILLTSYPRTGVETSIVRYDRSSGTITTVAETGCCAQPAAPDLVVYQTSNPVGQLVGQAYDSDSGELTGPPLDLAGSELSRRDWGVGLDGTLMFTVSGVYNEVDVLSEMNPESGELRTMDVESARYDRLSVSPDGRKAAVETFVSNLGDSYISVIDLTTGVTTRLTYRFDISRAPTWSTDGRIYYSAGPVMDSDIYAKNADGTGAEELIVEGGDYAHTSRDGRWLAYSSGSSLMALDIETGRTVRIDSTLARQGDAKISPNGRHIVFTADSQTSTFISNNQRMFVRSFPDPSLFFEKLTESFADDPAWAADGSAIYFRNAGEIFELPLRAGDVFQKQGAARLVRRLPGLSVRIEINPATGEIMATHPPEGSDTDYGVSYTLVESLPAYVEYLRRQ